MTNRVALQVAAALSHEMSAAVSSCPATCSDKRLVPSRRQAGDVTSLRGARERAYRRLWNIAGLSFRTTPPGASLGTSLHGSVLAVSFFSFFFSTFLTFLFQAFFLRVGLRRQIKMSPASAGSFPVLLFVQLNT